MWSSPLLLLVLLFTVTAGSAPTTTSTAATPSTTTITTVPATSTSTTTRATTTTTTRSPSARPSSRVTAPNAPTSGPAPDVSVASGVLTGQLSPGFAVAVVPLRGPGTWTVSGDATVRAVVHCPSVSGPVVGSVTLASGQRCELEITSTNIEALPTWQLTPAT